MTSPIFTDEYHELCDLLRTWREEAGLSQSQLAARLGRSQSHIQRIESGQRRLEALELYRLAKALEASPTALFAAVVERFDRLRSPVSDAMLAQSR